MRPLPPLYVAPTPLAPLVSPVIKLSASTPAGNLDLGGKTSEQTINLSVTTDFDQTMNNIVISYDGNRLEGLASCDKNQNGAFCNVSFNDSLLKAFNLQTGAISSATLTADAKKLTVTLQGLGLIKYGKHLFVVNASDNNSTNTGEKFSWTVIDPTYKAPEVDGLFLNTEKGIDGALIEQAVVQLKKPKK